MKLYRRTDADKAAAILAVGFVDADGTYLTDNVHRGVWLADRPLDANEGASGDALVAVTIPDDVVAEYEWIEEGKPYREFLVPANVVNRFGPAEIQEDTP